MRESTGSVVELTQERRGQRLAVAGSGQQEVREPHQALLVDEERLSRVAARFECSGRGPGREREARPVRVERAARVRRARRGRRTRSRSRLRAGGRCECGALRACAARRCGGACVARRGPRSRAAPSRHRTRRSSSVVSGGDRVGRARSTAASSSSATASAVAPVPSSRPGAAANAARRVASGPASARARASWPPASAAASVAAAAETPSRFERGTQQRRRRTGSKSMRWQRDRIVGSRSSAPAVTSSMMVRGGGSSMVFSIAFADSFWLPAQPSRPRTGSAPCARPRSARGRFGEDRVADVFLDRYDAPPGSNSTTSGCTPRCTSRSRARRRRRRRAAPRTHAPRLRPRAARTDEQVRVRRAFASRARSVSSARSCPTMSATHASSRHGQRTGSTAAQTRSATSSGRPPASTTSQPRSAASSRYAARTRRVELGAGPLEAVTDRPRREPRRRRRADRARRRHRVRGPPAATRSARSTVLDAELAAHALVRERRRREAVADDHDVPRRGRAGSRSATCWAGLRASATAPSSASSRQSRVQQQLPNLLADLRCRPARA